MSSIFISHSSRDKVDAERVETWLQDLGHSTFLDFDLNRGIAAGGKWEEVLYRHLKACKAVVVLCSRESMESKWCFMEITHARALGKPVFPVKIDDCEVDGVLDDTQLVDLTAGWDAGLERLRQGLLKQGIDPKEIFGWKIPEGKKALRSERRSPYPGLLALQEKHAGVFFGRDDECQKARDLLRRVHRYRNVGMVLVSGASGTGKSSLVRAGLIPRLRRVEDSWTVIDPFRPLSAPFHELAQVLATAFRRAGSPKDVVEIEAELVAAGATVDGAQNPLVGLARELRDLGQEPAAVVLLTIDQFEELLEQDEPLELSGRAATPEPAREPSPAGPDAFLRLVRDAVEAPHSPLVVLATLRDDFLGVFNRHPRLHGIAYDELRLAPMTHPNIRRVIEGPAEMAGIEIEPALVDLLHAEAKDGKSLPLLAFALRKLDEDYGDDWKLELDEYRRSLGSLSQAVGRTADELIEAELGIPGYASLRGQQRPEVREQLEHLRLAFLRLVRVTEDGKFARRPAAWEELPEGAHPVLRRFVDERLLVAGGSKGDDPTVEVAHEALYESWGLLKRWLTESSEALTLRHEIEIDARRLQEARREIEKRYDEEADGETGHGGGAEKQAALRRELEQVEEDFYVRGSRLERVRELIASEEIILGPDELGFVEASYEASIRDRKAKERRNRIVISTLTAALVLILAVAAWGWLAQRQAVEQRDKAETIQHYFEDVLVPVEEELRSYGHPDLSSLVHTGAEKVSVLESYPDFKGRMLDRWATAYVAIGDPESAESLYRQAVGLYEDAYEREASPANATQLISALLDWTLVLPKDGAPPSDAAAWKERIEVGKRALEVGETTLPEDPLTVKARGEWAADLMRVGDPRGWPLLMKTLGQAMTPPKGAAEVEEMMGELEAQLDRISFLEIDRFNPENDFIFQALERRLKSLEEEDGVEIDDELYKALPTALEALAEHYYLRAAPTKPKLADHLYRCAEIYAIREYGERNILTLIIQQRRARFLLDQERRAAAEDLRSRLVAARNDALATLSPLETKIIGGLDAGLGAAGHDS